MGTLQRPTIDPQLRLITRRTLRRVYAPTPALVKGFRTPASHWREGMHGGRRPKSLEGGNRGPWVERRGAMELWGFESRGQSAATWAWRPLDLVDCNDRIE